jgi:hypothetical protein
MASLQEVEALIYKCLKVYVGPGLSDLKDVREQLCGEGQRDAGQFGGWTQLGDGPGSEHPKRTIVDGLGHIIAELKDGK